MPLAAMTPTGRVARASGSTMPIEGLRRGLAMPSWRSYSSKSKMAMPVHSLAVPKVVGQAMCGRSGPGTGSPLPIGALT